MNQKSYHELARKLAIFIFHWNYLTNLWQLHYEICSKSVFPLSVYSMTMAFKSIRYGFKSKLSMFFILIGHFVRNQFFSWLKKKLLKMPAHKYSSKFSEFSEEGNWNVQSKCLKITVSNTLSKVFHWIYRLDWTPLSTTLVHFVFIDKIWLR